MSDRHNHNTRGALRKLVNVPISKTTFYGTQSITAKSVNDWNSLQNQIAFLFENDHVITSILIASLRVLCHIKIDIACIDIASDILFLFPSLNDT